MVPKPSAQILRFCKGNKHCGPHFQEKEAQNQREEEEFLCWVPALSPATRQWGVSYSITRDAVFSNYQIK